MSSNLCIIVHNYRESNVDESIKGKLDVLPSHRDPRDPGFVGAQAALHVPCMNSLRSGATVTTRECMAMSGRNKAAPAPGSRRSTDSTVKATAKQMSSVRPRPGERGLEQEDTPPADMPTTNETTLMVTDTRGRDYPAGVCGRRVSTIDLSLYETRKPVLALRDGQRR